MNNGPKPSEAWVEEGELTQTFLKRPLPTKKSCLPLPFKLALGWENAFPLGKALEVEAPAELASNAIGLEKSVGSAVTAATRTFS